MVYIVEKQRIEWLSTMVVDKFYIDLLQLQKPNKPSNNY